MHSWVKTYLKARQTIAMMVVISMLLPMVSWASDGYPVSATLEKEFLQQFEANQNHILKEIENKTDSDADGEMIWVYIDPKINVRYMMKQNRDGDFDFYAQTKKFQKKVVEQEGYTRWIFDHSKWTWETKFNGHRIGVLTYSEKTPIFKAELTSKTIDQNLLAKKIHHVSTRGTTYGSDGKIVLSLEMIQKKTEEERKQREFSEIANQCTALVKFDDVRGRNLIQKTFNIERTKSSYTSQQMESFKDSIQKKYEANDFSSYVMMYSILNISMNTSLYTMMIFREMFLGPKTKSDLQTYFGQSATFGSETVKNETYRKAAGRMISAFIAERAKTPIPSMEGPNLDSEIQAFNGNIQKINDICNQARKFYKNTAASYNGTATLGFMTPKDSLAKYTSDQYFIKIYGEQTEGYLKALRDSKLGILLFSDSFREKVGSFDAKACSQEAVGLTTDPITKSDIMTGVDEVRTTFIHLIKDAVKDYASAKPAEVVEKYIQAFPLTVQKVMNFTKSKEDALLACGVIEDIYSDDYWMDKFDMGLMIGGVSAGVICAATGMGVPASAAIMGTFTVADMASGGVKWAKGYTLENAVRGAGVSGQTEHVKGQEDLQKAKALKSEGQLQVGLSAAGEFGGYFGTKGFIYLRNTYRTKLARDFFKTQDVQVVSYIESIFSKPKYSQIDSNHLAQVLEDAKKANEYSGVPAKLKALGLDDIDAKEVTRMVSQANEERLIFDELQGVIAQKKYAGKEKEAIVILHSVAKKGSVMRAGPAISYNSNERIDALIKARKYLIKLGFEADDVTKMMDELFNENTGALLGKIEKAEVGKFGAYSTKNPDATDLVIHGKKTPWVQSTVDEAKDLIKHKYTSPGDFFAIREKFKKGGTIQFGNGKVFSIKSIYDDTGARNTILELDSGRLLRIPKKQTFGLNDSPSSFISGHQVLEGAGVPIVKVFEHSHDYVLVEKLTNSRNIRNYTHYLEVRNELPELARKKMDADFLKFAQKTKNVEYVGDFSGEQIVYSDHRGWVLADITDDVRVFDGKGNMTVFDSEIFAKYTPDEMVEKFREAVHKSRLSVKPNVASEASASTAHPETDYAGMLQNKFEEDELNLKKIMDRREEVLDRVKKINEAESSGKPIDHLEASNIKSDRRKIEIQTLEISDRMTRRMKDILGSHGIESSIVEMNGRYVLRLNFKSGNEFYDVLERYFAKAKTDSPFQGKIRVDGSTIQHNPKDAIEFVYDPVYLRQERMGACVVGTSTVRFDLRTIENILLNRLGPLEHHEMIHVEQAIRRKKGIPSRVYDQRFEVKDWSEADLGIEKPYDKNFYAEEFRAYGDTFQRLSVELRTAEHYNPNKIDDFAYFIESVQKMAKATLKNTDDLFQWISSGKATLRNGYITHHGYEDYDVLKVHLEDGRAYANYFVSPEQRSLVSNMRTAQGDFHELEALIIEKIKQDLIALNNLAYKNIFTTLDLLRDINRVRYSSVEEWDGMSAETLVKLIESLDNNAKSILAATKETHPSFSLSVAKLDDQYWSKVIQGSARSESEGVAASTQIIVNPHHATSPLHSGLEKLRVEAVKKYPNLNGTEVAQAAYDVQSVMYKKENILLNQDKAIRILEDAHNTGHSVISQNRLIPSEAKKRALVEARQKLQEMGYSKSDADFMIKRLADDKVRMLGKKVELKLPEIDVLKSPALTAEYHASSIRVFSNDSLMISTLDAMNNGGSGIIYMWDSGHLTILKVDKVGTKINLLDIENGYKEIDSTILSGESKVYQYVDTSKFYNPDFKSEMDFYVRSNDDKNFHVLSKKFSDRSVKYGSDIKKSILEDQISLKKIVESPHLGKAAWGHEKSRVKLYTTSRGEKFVLKRGEVESLLKEKAAFISSEELKLGLVPPVDVIEVEGLVFSVQRYVENALEKNIRLSDDVHMFDFLTGGIDRSPRNNILADIKGRVWLIDHQEAFVPFDVDEMHKYFRDPADRNLGKRKFLAMVGSNHEFMKKMSVWSEADIKNALDGLLSDQEFDALFKRRTYLIDQYNKMNQRSSVSSLDKLKKSALQNHPKLSSMDLDRAVLDVQAVLDRYPSPINQDKAIEILEKAHSTGKSTVGSDGKMTPNQTKKRALVKARQDLVAMGYSVEDSDFMIKRLADDKVRMLGSSSGEFTSSDARHGLQTMLGGISNDVLWNLGNVNGNYYLSKFYHALDNLPLKEKKIFSSYFKENKIDLMEFMQEQDHIVPLEHLSSNISNSFDPQEKALMIKLIASIPDDQVLRYVREVIEGHGFVPVQHFRELDTIRSFNGSRAMNGPEKEIFDSIKIGYDDPKRVNKLKSLFNEVKPASTMRYFGSTTMNIQGLNKIKSMIQSPGDTYPLYVDQVLSMQRDALPLKSLDQIMMVIDTHHAIEYRPTINESSIYALVHDPKGYNIYHVEEIDGYYYVYARGASNPSPKHTKRYQSYLAGSGDIANENSILSESPATLYFSSLRGEKGTHYEYKMLQFFERGKYRHNRSVTEKETLDILYHYREKMHSIEAPASARMVIDGVETSRNEIIGKLEIELIQTLVDMGWRELDAASMVRMFRYHDIL